MNKRGFLALIFVLSVIFVSASVSAVYSYSNECTSGGKITTSEVKELCEAGCSALNTAEGVLQCVDSYWAFEKSAQKSKLGIPGLNPCISQVAAFSAMNTADTGAALDCLNKQPAQTVKNAISQTFDSLGACYAVKDPNGFYTGSVSQSAKDDCLKLVKTTTGQTQTIVKGDPKTPLPRFETWTFTFHFTPEYLKELEQITGKKIAKNINSGNGVTETSYAYNPSIEATCEITKNGGRCLGFDLNLFPAQAGCKGEIAFDVNFREKNKDFSWFGIKNVDKKLVATINQCEQLIKLKNQCSNTYLSGCFGAASTDSKNYQEPSNELVLGPQSFMNVLSLPTEIKYGISTFTLFVTNKETKEETPLLAKATWEAKQKVIAEMNIAHPPLLNPLYVYRGVAPPEREVIYEQEDGKVIEPTDPQGFLTKIKKVTTKIVSLPYKITSSAFDLLFSPVKPGYAYIKERVQAAIGMESKEAKSEKEMALVTADLGESDRAKLSECEQNYRDGIKVDSSTSYEELKAIDKRCSCDIFSTKFVQTCKIVIANKIPSLDEYTARFKTVCSKDLKKAVDKLSQEDLDKCYASGLRLPLSFTTTSLASKRLGDFLKMAASTTASWASPGSPSASTNPTTTPSATTTPTTAQEVRALEERQFRALSETGLPVEVVEYHPSNAKPGEKYFSVAGGGLIGSYDVGGQPLGGISISNGQPNNLIFGGGASGGGLSSGGAGTGAGATPITTSNTDPSTDVKAEPNPDGSINVTATCKDPSCEPGVATVQQGDQTISFVTDPTDLTDLQQSAPVQQGRTTAEKVSLFVLLFLLIALGGVSWYYFKEKKESE